MKKIWKKIFVAAFPLAIATSFTTMAACTDYSQELEDEYSYLRDEETADNNKEIDEDDDNVSSSDSSNKSSADSKSSSSKKNSSSVDDDDTDDNGDKDDSGNKDTPNSSSSGKSSSSSNKKEGTLTSSETIIYETTCENVPYTVKTAGPNHGWGNFGYVIPLKITSSKTQELHLAFDTVSTSINGPATWETYGVLVSQYDAQKNEWIPGTEIFSKEIKSARDIIGDQNGNVNTYGIFEKFSFETKGTWLEKSAGKSIDVVVTFYAPGTVSDSSGMGLDYYSIPRKDTLTNNALYKLYYSESAMECSLPLKGELKFSYSCFPSTNKDVYQGDTIALSVTGPHKTMTNKSWFSIKSEAGNIVKTEYNDFDYISTVYVVYPTLGTFNENLTFTYLPGKEIKTQCRTWYHSNSSSTGAAYPSIDDVLEVLPSPVKNCSCTASAIEIDVANVPNGGVASWTLSGCQSISPITSYEWYGTTTATNTTATYAFGGEKAKVTPTVKVSNEDNTTTTFTCPTVTGYDKNDPDYVFKGTSSSDIIDFPAGKHVVEFEVNNQWGTCSTMMCDIKNYDTNIQFVTFEGKTYSNSFNIVVPIDASYCRQPSVAEIEFSADMSCHIY